MVPLFLKKKKTYRKWGAECIVSYLIGVLPCLPDKWQATGSFFLELRLLRFVMEAQAHFSREEINSTVWEVPEKYTRLKQIGTGAYGSVWWVTCHILKPAWSVRRSWYRTVCVRKMFSLGHLLYVEQVWAQRSLMSTTPAACCTVVGLARVLLCSLSTLMIRSLTRINKL